MRKDWYFNTNTLKNAENHIRDTHFLNELGDLWIVPLTTKKAQPSSVINSSYEKVIILRIQEFKNAFLEWVILDDISHRKACSKRLLRVFKIANLKALRVLPSSPLLIVT